MEFMRACYIPFSRQPKAHYSTQFQFLERSIVEVRIRTGRFVGTVLYSPDACRGT
jgi:hypothetical protein